MSYSRGRSGFFRWLGSRRLDRIVVEDAGVGLVERGRGRLGVGERVGRMLGGVLGLGHVGALGRLDLFPGPGGKAYHLVGSDFINLRFVHFLSLLCLSMAVFGSLPRMSLVEAKTKYRGLSTTAAKAPPSVEMTSHRRSIVTKFPLHLPLPGHDWGGVARVLW
jgi:hypothetical protein